MKTLLHAQWLAPMDRPPYRDGGVVFADRRILAVGGLAAIRAAHPDAEIENLGDVVILPGLVNPHTHLELSDCDCNTLSPGSFIEWLKSIIQNRLSIPDQKALVRSAVARGVAQCLRFGVTTIGDISRECRLTRPQLAKSPLRAVSYGEVQAMGKRRDALEERLAEATDATDATPRLRIGISPHAPYSIEPAGYQQCLSMSRQRNLPLATHLAEHAAEAAFLADHGGDLLNLWNWLGFWDDQVPRFVGGPIRLAKSIGLIDYPSLLAHVNYCDDDELAILAAGKASVVYNPRTHKYFGHPPHRWRDMLRSGVNVAVGTDSCASSPDLNLVDELRLLRSITPDMPATDLWAMATARAAHAIGMSDVVGTLSPGKSADFVVFPAAGDDPLAQLLDAPVLPAQVWIAGRRIGNAAG